MRAKIAHSKITGEMRRVMWACVVLLAGCFDTPPEVRAQIACTTVCTCFVTPGNVPACVEECVTDGELGVVPDDCFECIQIHANQCSTLEADCERLCEPPTPPPDLPDGGMS